MIDYEKLKLAHELADKLNFDEWRIVHTYGNPDKYFILIFYDKNNMRFEEEYKELNSLIYRLTELISLKNKYKVGQKVWRVNCYNEPHEFIISEIDSKSEEMYFEDINDEWWTEKQLYESKEELIDSQIAHWNWFRDKMQ